MSDGSTSIVPALPVIPGADLQAPNDVNTLPVLPSSTRWGRTVTFFKETLPAFVRERTWAQASTFALCYTAAYFTGKAAVNTFVGKKDESQLASVQRTVGFAAFFGGSHVLASRVADVTIPKKYAIPFVFFLSWLAACATERSNKKELTASAGKKT